LRSLISHRGEQPLTAALSNGGTLKLRNKTAPYDESREGLFLDSCGGKVFNPTRRSIQQEQEHARLQSIIREIRNAFV
jgi:hypothetical protein